ncbi:mechanosensitive ion channel family protein [Allorhizobium sp. BGMRC 0089]|uniref:mechanosensitive ion channel family protein n=1 Tax=Allorhizobium sonneratiae TaxID=2934936 RepID=UPI002033BEAD|nr:mechanosensitive ion channel family protein [Allorhizobium sonneratiae]MCM2293240.1 mechanosensitive ion channel family protein [Allorhizobium sonneratiae]
MMLMLLCSGGTSLADSQAYVLKIPAGQNQADLAPVIDALQASGKTITLEIETPAAKNNSPTADKTSPLSAPITTSGSKIPTSTAPTPPPSAMPVDMMASFYDSLINTLTRGGTVALTGLQELPTAFQNSLKDLDKEQTGEQAGMAEISVSASLAILLGLVCAALFHLAAMRLLPTLHPERGPLQKAMAAMLRLIVDCLAILLFTLLARSGNHMWVLHGSLTRQLVWGLINTLSETALFISFGRLLFADIRRCGSLLPIPHAPYHLVMMAGFGFLTSFTSTTLRLADVRGIDPMATDGWLFLVSTLLTVYKLVWILTFHADISTVFAARSATLVQKLHGNFIMVFYALTAILLWAVGLIVTGTAQNEIWTRIAGTSQLIFVVLPIVDHGIASAFRALGHYKANKGNGLVQALITTLPVPLGGIVWLLGLHMIIVLWTPWLSAAGLSTSAWPMQVQQFGLTFVATLSVCIFCWRYFNAIAPANRVQLPGQDQDGHTQTTSRLSTVLPVIRNLVLGAVMAIALLVILSSLGINIAPLLAGFGVLGLAVSFGSQTLVKDVVSGIFFLAEDAFRIGEYIDTGKLKGTVEQISLRSVRLRHHNGPVHTIPFGQIAAVTNFSRDWGTVKFEFRFERDADIEVIRKAAKKVGQSLLEHPEFGHEFLVPLKMQGIQDITENSMVIRFKFTSRPGNPSLIKREGVKRLLAAFKDAGLNLASNAVVVRSGTGTIIDGAASTVIATPPAANIP